VTIPNGVEPAVRRRLAELGADGLARMNRRILNRGRKLVKRGAWIQAQALQRHYPTQRSHGITDARLIFKLDTSSGAGPVKRQFRMDGTVLEVAEEQADEHPVPVHGDLPVGIARC